MTNVLMDFWMLMVVLMGSMTVLGIVALFVMDVVLIRFRTQLQSIKEFLYEHLLG